MAAQHKRRLLFKKTSPRVSRFAKHYRIMTSGWQGTPFTRYGRELVSKPAIFVKEMLGGLPWKDPWLGTFWRNLARKVRPLPWNDSKSETPSQSCFAQYIELLVLRAQKFFGVPLRHSGMTLPLPLLPPTYELQRKQSPFAGISQQARSNVSLRNHGCHGMALQA